MSRRPGALSVAWGFAGRKPMGVLGALIVCGLVLTAVFADRIAMHKPEQVRAIQRFRPPSQVHWFGTDDFGRDVFSRVAHGARISLRIGITAVLLGTTAGALIGLISGYLGGRTDLVVQRIMDGHYPRRSEDKDASVTDSFRESASHYTSSVKNSKDPLMKLVTDIAGGAGDLGGRVRRGFGGGGAATAQEDRPRDDE